MSKAAELAKFIADGTFGTGGEEDKKLVFDGNAQDFHIGLDDSADSLTIGLGSTLGTTSHMVFDANGHITKPLQPAFLVQKTAQNNISGSDQLVTFETERFDVNGDFASNTFTAPVTGKYQFNINLYFDQVPSDASYIEPKLVTSNRTVYGSTIDPEAYDSDPTYLAISFSVLVDMDASDTATVKVTQAGGTAQADINGVSAFSGYLVC